ncbi:hypothetical protein ACN20G_27605 (plasmid) [Streptomyces sp. BI20]|uniref:hypothetical protein n=1 Tax=Streptomyces sp. BI20 TaxID=3403460 RepID=UPI003C7743E3
MILLFGLIVLAAAAVVGLAGVFANLGTGHGLGTGGDFSVLGYHVIGSTGSLFLLGIIVGGAALLGLALVAIGLRRSTRARRGYRVSRREAAVVDREREDLIAQRDEAQAGRGMGAGAGVDAGGRAPVGTRRRGRWFGHRTAHR